MKVIERNVVTGVVTERDYTDKEKAQVIDAENVSKEKRLRKAKEENIRGKRKAAVEELLMAATSPKAIEYQNVIK